MKRGSRQTSHVAGRAVFETLAELDVRINEVLQPIVDQLQAVLNGLGGKSFGTVEANQRAASHVQRLLNRLGKRVRCPKKGCGQPAILRCHGGAGKGSGVFQFEHSTGGRKTTHLAAATLPELRIVEPRPDKRKLSSASD
jgi:hypothetical protein